MRIPKWLTLGFRRVAIFKVKIIYKSGAEHTFETPKFKITSTTIRWINWDDQNKPVAIGFDDIAAVWQVGFRVVLTRREIEDI